MTESAQENSRRENLDYLRNKYLTFLIGEEIFAMEVHRMKEIVSISAIQERRAGRDYIRGVIRMRGEEIPIIDLGKRFGIQAGQDTSKSCFIVVEAQGASGPILVGMLVDQVSEVVGLAEGQIQSTHDFDKYLFSELLEGMVILDEKIILVMDLEMVIPPEDVKLFEEMLLENTQPDTPQPDTPQADPPQTKKSQQHTAAPVDAASETGDSSSASASREEGPDHSVENSVENSAEMSQLNADPGGEISQQPPLAPEMEPMEGETAAGETAAGEVMQEPDPHSNTTLETELEPELEPDLEPELEPTPEDVEEKEPPVDGEATVENLAGTADVTEESTMESPGESALDSSEDMPADPPPDSEGEEEPPVDSEVPAGYFNGAWESASIGGENSGDFDPLDGDPMEPEPMDRGPVDSSFTPSSMEAPALESEPAPAAEPPLETADEPLDGEGDIMELQDPIVVEDPPPAVAEEAVELEGSVLEEVDPDRSKEMEPTEATESTEMGPMEPTEATEDTLGKEDTESALMQLRRALEDVQAKLAKSEAAQVETQHALTEAWAKVAQLESERK